ncbi:osmoprotectant transport system ATP-binding protein [Planifilum fimeticola]|uniref:Carnitine transport ATP-binding protein OpuCA n=1 Tax=Planifilum fimeticola TaxID=201975 RepID=A0A2T0LER8_9BACL|nr:ABC transporter ATP-binding protein [Planifilum fimeticola]PRX40611.1 osmoprotectant transport system ATP-binding protein [Planifilum fimeticola]
MIELQDVTKVYRSEEGEVTAVDGVSMSVGEGEICILLGPSGCGKTTLLRMINRMIEPTRGTIRVNGQDIQQMDPYELRRSIGYVIQQTGLFPNMTVEQNVTVVPRLLGWDRVKIRNRYNELMDMMGLNPDEYRDRYPWELSGGQQQRIGVARALAADPPVMLMDEPFAALDPVIREHLQNELLRIQRTVRKTILFVSHQIDEAIRLGDTIAVFQSGKLMQHGTPDELLSRPANDFVSRFVGSDRHLRRLGLFRVRDLLDRKEKKGAKNAGQIDQRHSVRLDTTLREALSLLLASPAGSLAVLDDEGQRVVGRITWSDFEKLGEIRPSDPESLAQ